MWSANEELRKTRENQERSDFERWQRDNPDDAEFLRKENEKEVRAILKKKKEAQEAQAKAEKEIELFIAEAMKWVLPLGFAFVAIWLFQSVFLYVARALAIDAGVLVIFISALVFAFFIALLIRLSGRRR